MRYLPREGVRALKAMRPEEAGPEDAVFGLSGRQVGRRVAAAAAAAGGWKSAGMVIRYTRALVAVMRKLVGLLDTLLREDRLWQPEPPTRTLQAAA